MLAQAYIGRGVLKRELVPYILEKGTFYVAQHYDGVESLMPLLVSVHMGPTKVSCFRTRKRNHAL